MRFILPRNPGAQPVVIDRIGRNLTAEGIDIISMSYTISPQGEYVTLQLGGTATPPNSLPVPFRLVTGERVTETRLYDHTNTELVNALRATAISPLSDNGLVGYQCVIPLTPRDSVEIR